MFKKVKIKLKNTEDQSKRILSIPTHHNLSKKQIKYVVETINDYYGKKTVLLDLFKRFIKIEK